MYRGKHLIEIFSEFLREHAIKIISLKKKKKERKELNEYAKPVIYFLKIWKWIFEKQKLLQSYRSLSIYRVIERCCA